MCPRRCSASDGQWARHALRDLNEVRRGEARRDADAVIVVGIISILPDMHEVQGPTGARSESCSLPHPHYAQDKREGDARKRTTDKKKMEKMEKGTKGK